MKPSHDQRVPAPHAPRPARLSAPGARNGSAGPALPSPEVRGKDGDGRVVCCEVAAHAGVRLPVEALPEWRRQQGPLTDDPLPPAFLKHADEQTVAGLAAVFRAVGDSGLAPAGFRDWGVLAAPRFLGRPALQGALQRFEAEGAWGVSPHLIPHRSLHSISGTVSQALKIRGPNFGVGGGPNSEAEALLTALALMECQRLPGVWVVLTRLEPDRPADPSGRPAPGTLSVALALALVPPRPDGRGPRLRLGVGGAPSRIPVGGGPAGLDLFRLEGMLTSFRESGRREALAHALDPVSWIELSAFSDQRSALSPTPTHPIDLAHPAASLSANHCTRPVEN